VIAGEQDSQIFGVYVEPAVVGDGDGGNYGHCACQRRGKLTFSLVGVASSPQKRANWYPAVVHYNADSYRWWLGLQGKPPDWQDFIGIICLLVINSTISFIEENNAGNAAAALMARLAPKTKVLRDGQWGERDAVILVPGDIVSIKLGDIIPADARLLEGDPLKIDQVGNEFLNRRID